MARKFAHAAHPVLPDLFRAVAAQHSKISLARPVPLHRAAGAVGKAQRPLALDQVRSGQLIVAPTSIRLPDRLIAGLAGDIGYSRPLGRHRIPEQRIVVPVCVIGGKRDARPAVKLIQQTVIHSAFILPHVDKLIAAG